MDAISISLGSTSDIAHIIQLAIAPVFLLTGIASILAVVSNRLARVIDRMRWLEREVEGEAHELTESEREEFDVLDRRMGLCHFAVGLCTSGALFICLVIVVIFVADLVEMKLAAPVTILFILAMLSITFGLLAFLREVTIATRFVRVSDRYLRRKRRI